MNTFRLPPVHPVLRPGVEVVYVGPDKVLLRSFSSTVVVTGEFVAALPTLVPLLDGRRTVNDLVEMVGEDFRPETEAFLRLMSDRDILDDADRVGATDLVEHEPRMTAHEEAYWSLQVSADEERIARLQRATVVVAGVGGVGANVARIIAASHIGKLILLDPASVDRGDELFGYSRSDIGRPRVESLAEVLSRTAGTSVVSIPCSVDHVSQLSDLVAEASVILICSDNMSLAGYDRTNETCMQQTTPWVSARIDRSRAAIGPFVVPKQTACFTCFELRNRANADHPREHDAIYRHWKSVDTCPPNWPAIAPFASIVAGHVTVDLLRVLATGQPSIFLNRVTTIDLQTLETRHHAVLKLPRCPSCSRARERPLTAIWDTRSLASAQSSER
jgi:bacteriocin biosynthesis cyclodehydratase domain-containing protein